MPGNNAIDAWLTAFAEGAARLEGWRLCDGLHLRRLSADGLTVECPLYAQARCEAPGVAWDVPQLQDRYGPALVGAVMMAADACWTAAEREALAPLRARLLAACGVGEGTPSDTHR